MDRRSLARHLPPEFQARLREASGRLKGERREVTILFADLAGSTAQREGVDVELLKLIMDRVLGAMIEAVVEYEGVVAQLLGDGLLAFFGAPLRHEDDPERAVRAALGMQERLGRLSQELEAAFQFPVRARIGINAGEVLIGELGSELHLEYLAVGSAVDVAARLEKAAPPGGVLVGQEVYRQARAGFDFEGPLELELKGLGRPIPAYRLLRARPAPRRRRGIEGVEVPLAGREPELALFEGALQELENGRGQILLLLGEAGIGKSRLLAEARRWRGGELTWAEGRCLSYGANHVYHPFVDAVRELAGIDPGDSAVVAGLKLGRLVNRLPPGTQDRHRPLLETLLKVPLDQPGQAVLRLIPPEAMTGRLAEAVADLLQALAAQRPVVLVLDDLHWADGSSVELLRDLLPVTEREAVLVALVLRPYRRSPAWELLGHIHTAYFHRRQEIHLQPLPERVVVDLVGQVFPGLELPPPVRELILRKAEGSPFFLEEILRSLLEREVIARRNGSWELRQAVSELDVPDTVQKVILSRMDALRPEERAVLQSASVLGRHFGLSALGRMIGGEVGQPLLELVRSDFLRERSRGPEPAYMFKHWLTQEAVYSTPLEEERQALHARALEALEDEDAPPAELVRHALGAGLEERAYQLSLAAGDDAMRLVSLPEALRHYGRAVELAGRLGRQDQRAEAHARAGRALTRLSRWREAIAELGKALEAAGQENRERRAELLVELQEALVFSGDVELARVQLDEALELARALRRPDLEATLTGFRGMILSSDGELPAAIEHYQAALDQAEGAGVTPNANVPVGAALSLYWQGELETSVERGRTAARQAREAGHGSMYIMATSNLGLALAALGRYEEALESFGEAISTGREIGAQAMLARAMGIAAGSRLDLFDFQGAESGALEAQEQARLSGFFAPAVSSGIDLLFNYTRRGQVGRTEGLLDEVAERAANASGFHGWLWRLRLAQARAEIALARGQAEEALDLAEEALELSRARGRRRYEALALATRARALHARGRTREALQEIDLALALAGQMGAPALRLAIACQRLAIDADEAVLEQGRAAAEGILAALPDGGLRRALEAWEPLRILGRPTGSP